MKTKQKQNWTKITVNKETHKTLQKWAKQRGISIGNMVKLLTEKI
jgi:hypothetical protein